MARHYRYAVLAEQSLHGSKQIIIKEKIRPSCLYFPFDITEEMGDENAKYPHSRNVCELLNHQQNAYVVHSWKD